MLFGIRYEFVEKYFNDSHSFIDVAAFFILKRSMKWLKKYHLRFLIGFGNEKNGRKGRKRIQLCRHLLQNLTAIDTLFKKCCNQNILWEFLEIMLRQIDGGYQIQKIVRKLHWTVEIKLVEHYCSKAHFIWIQNLFLLCDAQSVRKALHLQILPLFFLYTCTTLLHRYYNNKIARFSPKNSKVGQKER